MMRSVAVLMIDNEAWAEPRVIEHGILFGPKTGNASSPNEVALKIYIQTTADVLR
jgi:hypothetical protein